MLFVFSDKYNTRTHRKPPSSISCDWICAKQEEIIFHLHIFGYTYIITSFLLFRTKWRMGRVLFCTAKIRESSNYFHRTNQLNSKSSYNEKNTKTANFGKLVSKLIKISMYAKFIYSTLHSFGKVKFPDVI